MSVVWGLVIMAIGVFFVASSGMRSRFVVYRLLVSRSRILWGDKVHRFYQGTRTIRIVVGLLVALGIVG
jgi:hypothetical protein